MWTQKLFYLKVYRTPIILLLDQIVSNLFGKRIVSIVIRRDFVIILLSDLVNVSFSDKILRLTPKWRPIEQHQLVSASIAIKSAFMYIKGMSADDTHWVGSCEFYFMDIYCMLSYLQYIPLLFQWHNRDTRIIFKYPTQIGNLHVVQLMLTV